MQTDLVRPAVSGVSSQLAIADFGEHFRLLDRDQLLRLSYDAPLLQARTYCHPGVQTAVHGQNRWSLPLCR